MVISFEEKDRAAIEKSILKPCPFCGGEAHLWVGNPKLHMNSSVSCGKCHITQSGTCRTTEEAIEAWNTRV